MNKRLLTVANTHQSEGFRWTGQQIIAHAPLPETTIPGFARDEAAARLPGLDIWDMWPVEDGEGMPFRFAHGCLWLALAAPVLPDPEDRHAIARIHLLLETPAHAGAGSVWIDHGPAFPDGHTPGSREWSGSAIYDAASATVLCWFTAAGRRGEAVCSFEQRLFLSKGTLVWNEAAPAIAGWSAPEEVLAADGEIYLRVSGTQGGVGTIKAFRDPCPFRDPATGRHYLFFTGSSAASSSPWNGVIGVAQSEAGAEGPWHLLPPLVDADGLNNELERPHMRHIGGLYYLFWSTQRKVFAEPGSQGATPCPQGPTGLYGVVGESPLGPFRPMNRSGLVAGNPESAPWQAYSWWVLGDGRVTSFADWPEVAPSHAPETTEERRAAFRGSPAPWFRLELEGESSRIQADSR